MVFKFGSRGKDVKKYKDMLYGLGYLKASTHDRFGGDTLKAVKAYQKDHKLAADGIIGRKTGPAIKLSYQYIAVDNPNAEPEIVQYLNPADYPGIGSVIINEINADLQDETDERRDMVREALKWVFPRALYVFGANLYNKKLQIQAPTPEYIDKKAKRNPKYFTGGRKDFMKKQYAYAKKKGEVIACADCSGFVVGLLRKLRLVKSGFDTTANGFYRSYCKPVRENYLKPADLVFKKSSSGHIPHMGMYIGAGFVIEAAGGAYGVQISRLNDHVVINKMTNKKVRKTAWKVFGDPKML